MPLGSLGRQLAILWIISDLLGGGLRAAQLFWFPRSLGVDSAFTIGRFVMVSEIIFHNICGEVALPAALFLCPEGS